MQIESYPGGGLTDPSNSLANDLVDRVEVLYMLGLLLVGKHSKLVQKELSDLQLIPMLSNLFRLLHLERSNGGRPPWSLSRMRVFSRSCS